MAFNETKQFTMAAEVFTQDHDLRGLEDGFRVVAEQGSIMTEATGSPYEELVARLVLITNAGIPITSAYVLGLAGAIDVREQSKSKESLTQELLGENPPVGLSA